MKFFCLQKVERYKKGGKYFKFNTIKKIPYNPTFGLKNNVSSRWLRYCAEIGESENTPVWKTKMCRKTIR